MKRFLIILTALFPLLGLAVLSNAARLQASPPQLSGGATFTVNSTIDATDANPGDGVCETAVGNGICTLRAAVQETNALPGADIIHLPSGIYTITIPGSDFDAAVGDLNITDSLMILGEGNTTTIIDGNDLDQIFDIRMTADKEVTLSDLTVTNGSSDFGGGLCHCTNDTKLYMNRVIVRNNENFTGGGGIYNAGYMEVISSTFQENNGGTGGGGIYNTGVAIIHKTNILSNTAPYDAIGGGILNNGVMTVTNSTIHGNSVASTGFGSNGGGIFNNGAASEIHLENSTISRNSAAPSFGGFANYGGIARLINVTVSENDHGGIVQFNGGATYITNTTIVSNTHIPPFQGGLHVVDGLATLANSIIAGETAADNCYGPITSAGHNLESGNSCGLSSTGDITNTNPMVGPLQANGGDTWTHALLTDSPAIDSGDDSACPATDQRGVLRPFGDHCDIGAYEYSLALTAIDDEVTTRQNTPVLVDVLANDVSGPNGDPMLDSVGAPMSGTAVITNTSILYSPDLDFSGTDHFTYTITDGVVTDTAVVTVTVLPLVGPTAVDDTAQTLEDEPVLIDVLANDLPGDNGDPTLESVGEPLSGTAVITNSFILYTPDPDFAGTDTFTYTVTDGVLTDTAVVTITVLPVDDYFYVYLPVVLKP
jgi:CSLREA domain-containing protein